MSDNCLHRFHQDFVLFFKLGMMYLNVCVCLCGEDEYLAALLEVLLVHVGLLLAHYVGRKRLGGGGGGHGGTAP